MAGELPKAGFDLIADDQIHVAMGHHPKALRGIDEDDIVRHMRTRFWRARAQHDRRRIDRALAARRSLVEFGRAAGGAECTAEILHLMADAATLEADRLRTRGPVGGGLEVAHCMRSRNIETWDDNTPPSPCSSASEASSTWRLPARPVICRCASTRCAIAPPTPQWP